MAILSIAINCIYAQVPFTVLDKAPNGADMFMDMALAAAQTSLSDDGAPCGAVVIERGGFEGTGMAVNGKTSIESALESSSPSSWSDVEVYTITEPTVKSLNMLNQRGVKTVYFVIPSQEVISKGVYPESAYDTANLDTQYPMTQLYQISFPEAVSFFESSK